MNTLRKKYYIELKDNWYLALDIEGHSWYLTKDSMSKYLFRFRTNAENIKEDLKLKGAKIKSTMA